MQNTYQWRIIPSTEPIVIRNCPKCGGNSEFESSKNFRVNANQNQIDVWLIYQCNKCKSTWNMEILARVSSHTIGNELYLKFLQNDKKLAEQYAFDVSAHNRCKATLSYESISYEIISDPVLLREPGQQYRILISCQYDMDIRLDKIISLQTGMSREQVKKLGKAGLITVDGTKDIAKAKLKNNMVLHFNY